MTNKSTLLRAALGTVVLALAGCGGTPSDDQGVRVHEVQLEAAATVPSFSVKLPNGLGLEDLFVSVTGHLTVQSQATLGAPEDLPIVANFGESSSYLQAEAKINGDVLSVGDVRLDAKTRVVGAIRTQGAIEKQGIGTGDEPIVEGGETVGAVLDATTLSWDLDWPAAHSGDLILNAAPQITPHEIAPGAYGTVRVHDRNHLLLRSGSYYFDSLTLEPQAEVHLDKTEGPIAIWIREELELKGPFVETGGDDGQTLVGYLGTPNVLIQGQFLGTLLAPRALIRIERPNSGSHRGAFLGGALELAAGPFTVEHVPFKHWGILGFVGPTGGTVRADGGRAVLDVPASALSETVRIQINRAPLEGAVPYAGLIGGTLYDFEPHGLTFAIPATLTIEYDSSEVPSGVPPDSLVILASQHGSSQVLTPLHRWEERPSSAAPATSRVSGEIDHFSHNGVGQPVTRIEPSLANLGLIPNTQQVVGVQLFGEDNARLLHVVDWASDDASLATASPISTGLDQALISAGNELGDTVITASVRNGPDAPDVFESLSVQVGLASLTLETQSPSSSYTRNDLNDSVTVALAHSTVIDLPISVSASSGTATFSAFTYSGQDVTVIDFPFYGLEVGDMGGAETSGLFSEGFGWPFVTGLTYSRMAVGQSETRSMNFNHGTGHIVRYVRGTCGQRIPWSELFQTIQNAILTALICETQDQLAGLLDVSRRKFQAQPHFRGRVGLSPLDQAPVEMGFFFETQYDVRVPIVNAGATIGMNPAYKIGKDSAGFVQIELINDHPNVQVINDRELPNSSVTVSERIRQTLRDEFPSILAGAINDALVQPLPAPLGSSCTPSSSGAHQVCFDESMSRLDLACQSGANANACVASQVLLPENFRCMDSGTCGFRPIVQQVNVLPEELELVFAPDPTRPFAPLDSFFRSLSDEICGDDVPTATRISQPVAALQLGTSGPVSNPPLECP